MKIYILADMEGISGIRKMEQVFADEPEYAEGRRLMMADVNNAIEAAFSFGAKEVVVNDTHGGGGQLDLHHMDARASYETPNAGRMMPSLDKSFDGLVLMGHHARAGTLNGFLDHTMSSKSWFEYKINNKVVGEIGIEAAWAAHYNVPVILVTGDETTASEARKQLGKVETAIVKWGIGRNRAKSLSLKNAHAVIRKKMERALGQIGSYKPFKPKLPATIELTFYRSDMADNVATHPDVERVDGRTVRRTVKSLLDICRI